MFLKFSDTGGAGLIFVKLLNFFLVPSITPATRCSVKNKNIDLHQLGNKRYLTSPKQSTLQANKMKLPTVVRYSSVA